MPLKSMSSAAGPSVLSSISTSSSFPLETEENFDEEEEYIPLLTSRQRFVESDFEEDEEEDTRSVRKSRRKPVKTVQLPPPLLILNILFIQNHCTGHLLTCRQIMKQIFLNQS